MAQVCSAALMVLPPGVLEKEKLWICYSATLITHKLLTS